MEDWLSKYYVLEIPDPVETDTAPMTLKLSDKPSRPSLSFINEQLYNKLNKCKDSISEIKNWEKLSRLLNPYEKVKYVSKNTVASRAFYKIYEIIIYFRTLGYMSQVSNSFHLCEAPGGFIQGTLSIFPDIDWYAQSLYTNGLKIDQDVSDPEKWIKCGSGSLYSHENVNEIIRTPHGPFDFITADGGFDTSVDPNNQEQYHLHLITCEIITAINIQKKGGTFVLKIFDCITKPTVQLLVFLKRYYKSVFIYKPRTSRFSNSEKYVVALDFMGPGTGQDRPAGPSGARNPEWGPGTGQDRPAGPSGARNPEWGPSGPTGPICLDIIKQWTVNMFCRDFGLTIPDIITEKLYTYNKFIVNNQIRYIEESHKAQKLSGIQMSSIEAIQNKRATEFCKAFGLNNDQDTEECNHSSNITVIKNENDIKKCILCECLYI
jgi:23S rRNA U2552 (ribose-2'-O)-methylase RlmE/FtsJ